MNRARRLLLCALLGLALAGCVDTGAWSTYRSQSALTDYRREQGKLAAYRECLAAGGREAECRAD